MVDRAVINTIAQVPLFKGLSKPDLKSLSKIVEARHYPTAKVIVKEGDPGVSFFVIVSGTARVEVGGNHVRTLNAGATFGEAALLRPRNARTATVIAESDVDAYTVLAWNFDWMVKKHPEIGVALSRSFDEQNADPIIAAGLAEQAGN